MTRCNFLVTVSNYFSTSLKELCRPFIIYATNCNEQLPEEEEDATFFSSLTNTEEEELWLE